MPSRSFITFVDTATTGVRQTFGKAGGMWTSDVMVQPGLRFYLPIFQSISHVSTRQAQHTFSLEVKTSDDVFAHLSISVQWRIEPKNVGTAFFSLSDPLDQIRSYVDNVVRSRAPGSTLDELFADQDGLSSAVAEVLKDKMVGHGYTIVDTLITDIEPDSKVKAAMNEINATARLKQAAQNEADAHYVKAVREAEADAERKRLQGKGMSDQRTAIMDGYKDGIKDISHSLGLSPMDILTFVQSIQHMDMMENVGKSDNTKVLFVDKDKHQSSLRDQVIVAQETLIE
jgi:regulator of protease activity HflC (stomatin/prohibitin superfamily)